MRHVAVNKLIVKEENNPSFFFKGETMSKIATLSEEDREELVKLYKEAQTTPVIALTTADMLSGRDWASQAWDRVRIKMDELGKKYGYNPRTVQVNNKTGEVFPNEERFNP